MARRAKAGTSPPIVSAIASSGRHRSSSRSFSTPAGSRARGSGSGPSGVLGPAQDLGRQVAQGLLLRLVQARRLAARGLAHQDDATQRSSVAEGSRPMPQRATGVKTRKQSRRSFFSPPTARPRRQARSRRSRAASRHCRLHAGGHGRLRRAGPAGGNAHRPGTDRRRQAAGPQDAPAEAGVVSSRRVLPDRIVPAEIIRRVAWSKTSSSGSPRAGKRS